MLPLSKDEIFVEKKNMRFDLISVFNVSNNNLKPQVYLTQDEKSQNLLCSIS